MSDFEYLIRSMIKNGATTHDITLQTVNILNAIDKETKEKKECDGRTETLSHYKHQIAQSYRDNDFDMADVAALAVVVCAKDFPKWGKKEMEELFNSVSEYIPDLVKMVGKTNRQVLSDLFDELSDLVSNSIKPCDAIKREKKGQDDKKTAESTKDFPKTLGTTKPCTGSMTLTTPEENLLKFLNSL